MVVAAAAVDPAPRQTNTMMLVHEVRESHQHNVIIACLIAQLGMHMEIVPCQLSKSTQLTL